VLLIMLINEGRSKKATDSCRAFFFPCNEWQAKCNEAKING